MRLPELLNCRQAATQPVVKIICIEFLCIKDSFKDPEGIPLEEVKEDG
jgi:hypothetical protein